MKTPDAFYYSGAIMRGLDRYFIDHVLAKQDTSGTDKAILVLVTPGGDPNAAYKISRCFQETYDHFTVIIPDICKSAGTLLAVGAEELVFGPYGELGPLDVQISKTDDIGRVESGLNIDVAFRTVENRAIRTFSKMVKQITEGSQGNITFPTAASIASGFSSSLYGKVLKKVDPEEVGSRARAMQIGERYCRRLNQKFGNFREGFLQALSRTYPDHGFVIDEDEAGVYFRNVRGYREEEELVDRISEYLDPWDKDPDFGDVPDSGSLASSKASLSDTVNSPESRGDQT